MQGHEREAESSAALLPVPVFAARGLSKVYGSGESQVTALKNVDLDIRQGEFIVLLGALRVGQVDPSQYPRWTGRSNVRLGKVA